MKIQIGFLDQPKATIEANGNEPLKWSGTLKGINSAKEVVEFYAEPRMGEPGPATGEELLQLLLQRLRGGHWWAIPVNDSSDRSTETE